MNIEQRLTTRRVGNPWSFALISNKWVVEVCTKKRKERRRDKDMWKNRSNKRSKTSEKSKSSESSERSMRKRKRRKRSRV